MNVSTHHQTHHVLHMFMIRIHTHTSGTISQTIPVC